MTETRRNELVAIFMLGGLALLGGLMVMFGETPDWLFAGEYDVAVKVDGLYGITESTVVDLNGVPVGRVKRLEFVNPERPGDVQVVAAIKKEFAIPASVIAKIQPGGLGLARGRVTLVPRIRTDVSLPQDGSALIKGEMVSAFSDLVPPTMLDSVDRAFAKVADLAEALTPAVADVQKLFEARTIQQVDRPSAEEERLTANLSTAVERFDASLKAFNETLGDPEFRQNFLDTTANIKEISETGRRVADNLEETSEILRKEVPLMTAQVSTGVEDLRAQMTTLSEKAIPVLDNLASAGAYASSSLRDIAEADGTAGRFLRDPELYEAMVLSVKRFTELVDTWRRMSKVWEDNKSTIRIRTSLTGS